MKTSYEITTKNFKLVLSLCHHFSRISHVLQTFYSWQVATYSKQSFLGDRIIDLEEIELVVKLISE